MQAGSRGLEFSCTKACHLDQHLEDGDAFKIAEQALSSDEDYLSIMDLSPALQPRSQ
jgi:hypothetical protein